MDTMDKLPFSLNTESIRTYAAAHHIPISSPSTEAYILQLIESEKPKRVLEIGCAIGFAAYLMLSSEQQCIEKYIGVDLDVSRLKIASLIKEEMKWESKASFLHADIRDDKLWNGIAEEKKFDFIFIDCAKSQYAFLLDRSLLLLNSDGTILFDDIFLNGELIAGWQKRRNKTVVLRMRKFLYELQRNPMLETNLIKKGNGMLSIKRKQE